MIKHLSELIADAAVYGWEPVQVFHAVWLQQLENGCADWGDEAKKPEFRCMLMWNPMHRSAPHKAQPSAQPQQKPGKDATGRPFMAKPRMKACVVLNTGKCITHADHPKELHICTYCFIVACKQCAHQVRFYRHKTYDEATKKLTKLCGYQLL